MENNKPSKNRNSVTNSHGPTTLEALKQLSLARTAGKLDKSTALITYLNNNHTLQSANSKSKSLTPMVHTTEGQEEAASPQLQPLPKTTTSARRSKNRGKKNRTGTSSNINAKTKTSSVGVQASGYDIIVNTSRSRSRPQSSNVDPQQNQSTTSSSSDTTKSTSSGTSTPKKEKQQQKRSSTPTNNAPSPAPEKSSEKEQTPAVAAPVPIPAPNPPATVSVSMGIPPVNNKPKTVVSKPVVRTGTPVIHVPKLSQSLAFAGPSAGVSHNWRSLVEKAVRDHKIFCIGGCYPAIRNALKRRGWVEKALNCNASQCMKTIIDAHLTRDVDLRPIEDETDTAYAQRVLANYPPDFVWVIRRDNVQWNQMARDQIINRFPKAFFTTKVGIAACIQSMHWFSEPGISDTFFPRCYRICLEEEKTAFCDDFRLTACLGLLRWVCSNYEREGEKGIYDPGSRVSSLCVDFAVRQINNYVRMRKHEDIDWLMPPAFMLQHWDVFLGQYYSVVQQKQKLGPRDASDSARSKYDIAKKALQRVAPFWPQLYVDGIANLWICKPGARSRGKGIIVLNQLEKILELLAHTNYRESNWVVQKYIERPLLIYKTKFDMRQWFIVTDWAPLTVWFAKESYVRFCSKPFSLEDFHESVHLSNNAVQCKYQNDVNRDSALPDENMWDCYTFQAYLKTLGKQDLWDKVIYPGMKQGILGVLLASQETADVRKNCFELYGADFMLSEDFRPWLIEINSCPCMAASTSVTARMCAQCLEDCIKVVVDRKEDKSADTGMFELIYRQNPATLTTQAFVGSELMVTGKRLSKDVDWPGIMTKYNSKRGSGLRIPRPLLAPAPPPIDSGLTFMDLVSKLRLKETSTPINLGSLQTVASSSSGGSTAHSNAAAATAAARRFLQTGTPLSIPQISFPQTIMPPRARGQKSSNVGGVLDVKKLSTLASDKENNGGTGRKSKSGHLSTL